MAANSFILRALQTLPAIIVFGLLGVIGWWGHKTGWKAPTWSEIAGRQAPPVHEDWCKAHNVPDSICIACHPDLAGESMTDWCKEHGVKESECTICHPEILKSGKALDWCREHGVPESGCNLCHPEIAVLGKAPEDENATKVVLDPDLPKSATCLTHRARVQFASIDAVRKAGIKLSAVREVPLTAVVTASGEIVYIQSRVARCSARVGGTVAKVFKLIGDRVQEGEVLALVDAAEIGRSKSELLQALAMVEVAESVFKRVGESQSLGFRTKTELAQAEAEAREARVKLFAAEQALNNLGIAVDSKTLIGLPQAEAAARVKLLGISDEVRKAAGADSASANLIAVVAPIGGIVTSADVVQGEVVTTEKALFVVADTSKMWAALSVTLEDIEDVRIGQKVLFAPDGTKGEAARGTVGWISTAANETTRMVEVRAELANPDGRLRAGTFGKGTIAIREGAKVPAVPVEAINWEGCCYVTFVRLTDEIFQTRKVSLGIRQSGMQEIVAGLAPGEVVVTEGSSVLRADLLRGRLGAG